MQQDKNNIEEILFGLGGTLGILVSKENEGNQIGFFKKITEDVKRKQQELEEAREGVKKMADLVGLEDAGEDISNAMVLISF